MSLIVHSPSTLSDPRPDAQLPDPADLVTDLAFDYDPHTLVGSVANGVAITSLASSAGAHGYTLNTVVSSLTKPKLTHSAVGGKAALEFDGTNAIQNSELSSASVIFDTSVPSTVAVLLRNDTPGGSAAKRIMFGKGATYRQLSTVGTGNAITSSTSAGGAVTRPTPAGWFLLVATIAAGGAATTRTTADTPATGTLSAVKAMGVMLGCNQGGAETLDGAIARLMGWSRVLTQTDINALYSQIEDVYGV